MQIIKHRHNMLLYFLFSSLLEHIFCLKAVEHNYIIYSHIFKVESWGHFLYHQDLQSSVCCLHILNCSGEFRMVKEGIDRKCLSRN